MLLNLNLLLGSCGIGLRGCSHQLARLPLGQTNNMRLLLLLLLRLLLLLMLLQSLLLQKYLLLLF